jgi:hypothetical protein
MGREKGASEAIKSLMLSERIIFFMISFSIGSSP